MKSDFINCKNCTDDCHCKGKNITPICISFKPAKTTNADRIRSMTDEELAEFVIGVLCYTKLPYIEVREKALRDNELLYWLKEEVTANDS